MFLISLCCFKCRHELCRNFLRIQVNFRKCIHIANTTTKKSQVFAYISSHINNIHISDIKFVDDNNNACGSVWV
jgi:hypothetical protein